MKLGVLGRSVRSRMLVAAILVEATMLTVLVVNSLRLLSGQMTAQAARHASQMTPVLHAALIAPLAQRDTATVQAILDECVASEGIDYLAVKDAAGKVVASSGWPKDRPLPPPDAAFRLYSAGDVPRYNVESQVSVGGQKLGTVHFGLDLSQILQAHQQLLTQGVLIAFGELFLSAGLLAVLGFWLTRHLTALTRASESVAGGNLAPALVAEGDDDVGRLGAAFNAMSRAVRERIQELTEARDGQATLALGLAEAHQRMEEITHAMGDGLYVLDEAGHITYVNPRVEEILHWTREELLGRSAQGLFHRSQQARSQGLSDPTLPSAIALEGSLFRSSDELFCRKDGSLIHVSLVSTPIIRDGKNLGAVVSFQDVTELQRSAQALRESEARFAAAVEGTGDGLWDWDVAQGRVYFSNTWKAMLGHAPEEVSDDLAEWDTRLHPDDRERVHQEVRQHLEGATPRYQCEHRLRHKDGSYIWILARGAAVERDPAGYALRMVGTHANIDFRKSMEKALVQRDRLLEAVSRSIAGLLNSETWEAGLAEFLEALGMATEVSRVYVFRLQNGAQVSEEAPMDQTHGWCAQGIAPQLDNPDLVGIPMRTAGFSRWADTLAADQMVSGNVHSFPEVERALLQPQGILSILVMPIHVRGKWWGFIGFDECAQARHWTTSEQEILRIAARALGAKVERTESLLELEQRVAERTRELDQKNLDLMAEMEARQHIEAANQAVMVELEQSRKMESIGRLAAGIAHEINTPIQFLGNNLEFIKKASAQVRHLLESYEAARSELPAARAATLGQLAEEMNLTFLNEEVPQAISESIEGIQRVTKIVRAMKEFSHPGGTEKVAVDINECLITTSTVARNEWKHIADLVLDLDPSVPTVQGLPAELNQAFLNLIVNASDAVAEHKTGDGRKGVITLSTRRHPAGVEIRITDNGVGIDLGIQKKIFDPFFTTKKVGKGTGQGLTVCYQVIVNRHGGTIQCESMPGAGTTFILRLPLGAGGAGQDALES